MRAALVFAMLLAVGCTGVQSTGESYTAILRGSNLPAGSPFQSKDVIR